ncbi:MAG: tol-pal system protein YbgF [Gammaproteobacteria bacterium]|nr:tol-pal system protein YbgF [Gammaproteobacteria bacterium]
MNRLTTILVCLALAPASAWAQGSVQERLERLERMASSGALMELLERVEGLQKEVRELRGQVEEQGHRLSQMGERQKQLYVDVDRRLQRMEAGRPVATAEPVPPTTPVAPAKPADRAPAPAAAVDPLEEQAAYEGAFGLLRDGRYKRAGEAFNRFLDEYPASGYADNALYWLGESHYVIRDFDAAAAAFRRVVAEHPNSDKTTHARLKIGYILHEQGALDQAEEVLTELVKGHPDSTAARLAHERLKRIRAERG